MSQEIETVGGKTITLEDKAVKTRDQIYDEAAAMLSALAMLLPVFRSAVVIETVAAALTEFVHWMHDPTGTHASPSQMISASIARHAEEKGKPKFDA